MAIGMIFVGRFLGISKSEKDQKGGENIGSGFNGIRNQGIRISEESRQTFYQRQTGITKNAEIGGSYRGLFVTGFFQRKQVETLLQNRQKNSEGLEDCATIL